MKVNRCFLAIALLFSPILSLSAQNRGAELEAAKSIIGTNATIGKQYALFIAIDAYRTWPALKKPVADAKEIKSILQQDYYVDNEKKSKKHKM